MNKTDFRKRPYTAPWCMAIETEIEYSLLGGSPAGNPDNHGGTEVIPPSEDNDDDNLTGAKGNNIWNGEE